MAAAQLGLIGKDIRATQGSIFVTECVCTGRVAFSSHARVSFSVPVPVQYFDDFEIHCTYSKWEGLECALPTQATEMTAWKEEEVI